MGKSISFFNPYSKGENQVTNYCGLMLKILYKESPEAFEKIINDFISNTGKSFECLPDFSQQKKKPESIPDLCFSQKSFEIYFETKETDWFYNNQIERHVNGFDSEKKADTCILFLLTKEFNSEKESNYGVDYALNKGVILQKITFKVFLNALKRLIVENEYNLSKYFREYLEEFEEYLLNNEFLNDWQNLLDVINCRGTKDEIEQGYYLCPNTKTYSHRRAKFFGAYWDKNVNYISEIRAKVIVANGEYSIAWKNTNENDAEIIAIAKDKISNCSDWRKEELENNEMQLFLLSEPLVKLDYRKDSRGGMFSSKRYFTVGARDLNELFKELNGQKWK